MKLTDKNLDLNKKFHELSEEGKLEFLLGGYSEVFDGKKGKFALPDQKKLDRKLTIPEERKLNSAIDNLNFLMTRFNMLQNPKYEGNIRELALLRFEYMLLKGDPGLTEDPQMIVTFFEKRGKPELIKPTFQRMAEQGVDYESLADRIMNNEAFEKYVGKSGKKHFKFRSRLHALLEDQDFSRVQAAESLMGEGFDLIQCNFNKWYASEKDFDISIGKKKFKESKEDAEWLRSITAKKKGSLEKKTEGPSNAVEEDHEEDEGDRADKAYNCSKEGIRGLDIRRKNTLEKLKDKTEYWIRGLAPLTSDYETLFRKPASQVESKMWDNLWGGEFQNLAYQLKGANSMGRTRNGLKYNLWALSHPDHRKAIDPILAQDSYAMILAGDILVGDLEDAVRNLNDKELQEFKNRDKIGAAINLAWETMQHPGESDEPGRYQPPRGYLYQIAKEFSEFLKDAPSAKPYLRLVNATTGMKLEGEEEKILEKICEFEDIERIYLGLGRGAEIGNTLLARFNGFYDRATEFCSLSTNTSSIADAVSNPVFRKYLSNEEISDALVKATKRTLTRKDKFDGKRDKFGTKKMVAAIYNDPKLRPYVEGKVNISDLVNGMIDDTIGWRDKYISKPLSLRGSYEISMGITDLFEAYDIADSCRSMVDSKRMGNLVACLLGVISDTSMSVQVAQGCVFAFRTECDKKDYFPKTDDFSDQFKFDLLANIYTREKKLGGLDKEKASNAVTNALFRANYVSPGRFHPSIDSMIYFLDTPLTEMLPTEGLGHDSIKEYKILHDFLRK